MTGATYDEANQLTGITGPNTNASLTYDPAYASDFATEVPLFFEAPRVIVGDLGALTGLAFRG